MSLFNDGEQLLVKSQLILHGTDIRQNTSSNPATNEIDRYGLSQVHAPVGHAKVDVVFVHGLNGDPKWTWTSDKSKIFWPAQLLPDIVGKEKARILVYGYDASITSFTDSVTWKKGKPEEYNHAEHLVVKLAANRRRRKATERPIIFVAHSLGGLIVSGYFYMSIIFIDATLESPERPCGI